MKRRKTSAAPLLLAISMLVAGCASSGLESGEMSASGPIQRINRCLVMNSDLMLELAESTLDDPSWGWELARNDPSWHQKPGIPDSGDHILIERNYRQRLRVSDGRPREYSNFSTRVREHRHQR